MVLEIVSCCSDFYCVDNTLNETPGGYYSISSHDMCSHKEQNAKAARIDILTVKNGGWGGGSPRIKRAISTSINKQKSPLVILFLLRCSELFTSVYISLLHSGYIYCSLCSDLLFFVCALNFHFHCLQKQIS